MAVLEKLKRRVRVVSDDPRFEKAAAGRNFSRRRASGARAGHNLPLAVTFQEPFEMKDKVSFVELGPMRTLGHDRPLDGC
jgi:hypothetical protein